MSEPLTLPRNCSNCHHYDRDGWCALPLKDKLTLGFIVDPARVVCDQQEPLREDEE